VGPSYPNSPQFLSGEGPPRAGTEMALVVALPCESGTTLVLLPSVTFGRNSARVEGIPPASSLLPSPEYGVFFNYLP
jgi:hypothetical protein